MRVLKMKLEKNLWNNFYSPIRPSDSFPRPSTSSGCAEGKAALMSFIILCFFTSFTHAAPADDLDALLGNVRSMKADFTQSVLDNRGRTTQKSYGRMAIERPGKFRWDVVKPIPQLIIANDTKLWIYDPDLQQLTIRSISKAQGESPALLLSHDNANLKNNFVVEAISQNAAKGQWFSLRPRQKGGMFEWIQMGFVNHQIQEMRLQDNLGHTTVVHFQNIQVNMNLPASLFNFKPSAKIDVIDETRKK